MDVLEIDAGLWRWTAYHDEWQEDVGCTFVQTEDGVVLIDPLVPGDDTARFWKALDRDVKRAKGRVHVFVTVFWHARSAAAMRERYDARIWAPKSGKAAIARRAGVVTDPFAIGDELPGGIEACRTARAAEVVYWVPEHSALVPGDVLIADGKGGTKMCPESWLPDGEVAPRSRRVAAPAARSSGAPDPRVAWQARGDGWRACARARARASETCSGSGSCSASVALLVVFGVVGYNRLVRLRNEADTGWANIDVQLQRRGDLIPNLVEAVKGYAAHERGVFEEVTKARAALQQARDARRRRRGERHPERRARPLVRRRGGVSRSEGVRELPPPARGPHGHGGQDQRRAPLLQLHRHALL